MSDSPSGSSVARLEAFSDGVFAIAITLLILDIRVPKVADVAAHATGGVSPGAALQAALLELWPHALAFFLSFAVVLVIWVNHHRIFTIVRRTDQALLFWNGLLLLFVTFVPFPTALLAEYMSHGTDGQFRTAALVYSANGFLISSSFQALWWHATRQGRLLPEGHDAAQIKSINDEYRWAPAAYFAIFLIAFVAPRVSVGLALAFVLAFSFQGLMTRLPKRRR